MAMCVHHGPKSSTKVISGGQTNAPLFTDERVFCVAMTSGHFHVVSRHIAMISAMLTAVLLTEQSRVKLVLSKETCYKQHRSLGNVGLVIV